MTESRALFLDRDGIINVDYGYVCSPERTEFIYGVFDLCRKAKALGYLLVVCTNQAGIARGLYTEDDFDKYMDWMRKVFCKEAAPLDGVYYCPHHPEAGQGEYLRDCDCRKPKPGMILTAQREFSIDLGRSIMLGDKPGDMQAGEAAGVGVSYLIQPVYSQTSMRWELPARKLLSIEKLLSSLC